MDVSVKCYQWLEFFDKTPDRYTANVHIKGDMIKGLAVKGSTVERTIVRGRVKKKNRMCGIKADRKIFKVGCYVGEFGIIACFYGSVSLNRRYASWVNVTRYIKFFPVFK